MLSEAEQSGKHQKIPHTFIQKSWVYIDIICSLRNMRGYIVRYISCTHRVNRKLHGKKAVIIFPEYFPVHKIPPAAHSLSQNQSRNGRISHQERILLFYLTVDKQSDKRGNHSAVYGHAAVPQPENPRQIVLIIVPRKYHIVNAASYNGKNDSIDGEIPVVIRILACNFRHIDCHQKPGKHAQPDNQSIESYIKSEYTERLRHVMQIYSQIWKRYIACIHVNLHFPFCPEVPSSARSHRLQNLCHTLNRNNITSPSRTT